MRLCRADESVRYVISRPSSARENRAFRSERLMAIVVGAPIAVPRRVRKMVEVGRYMLRAELLIRDRVENKKSLADGVCGEDGFLCACGRSVICTQMEL